MKSSYIALLVVVIIGGVALFNMSPKEVSAPVVTETPPQTTEATSTADDMNMTDEEHRLMMESDATTGTDVGMEMPIPDAVTKSEKMFMVNGKNFEFDVKEIRVKEGDTVTVHFMSEDGFHDLVIDEFNARTAKIQTGGMAMVTFTANKKGTFEYYCSVGKHRMNGMVGKLVVE